MMILYPSDNTLRVPSSSGLSTQLGVVIPNSTSSLFWIYQALMEVTLPQSSFSNFMTLPNSFIKEDWI